MHSHNPNLRLETFCDAVIAIAITLLILEIKVPHIESIGHGGLLHALAHHWPSWVAFVLSFGSILVAWWNHHNTFNHLNKTAALFQYANGFFLLTIVVIPFPTALMAEYINTEHANVAVLAYCVVSLVHNISWLALFQSIQKKNLAKNDASRKKIVEGKQYTTYGFFVYLLICVIAYWFPITALVLINVTWIMWVVVGIMFSDKEAVEAVAA
jgi:uncharacterized membrane protein